MESFSSNYEMFLKLVDPVLLDSLKERRTLILDRWELISHDIVRRHEEALKGVSDTELEIEVERDKTELDSWLTKAENFLAKMSTEAVLFSNEEMQELQVTLHGKLHFYFESDIACSNGFYRN